MKSITLYYHSYNHTSNTNYPLPVLINYLNRMVNQGWLIGYIIS